MAGCPGLTRVTSTSSSSTSARRRRRSTTVTTGAPALTGSPGDACTAPTVAAKGASSVPAVQAQAGLLQLRLGHVYLGLGHGHLRGGRPGGLRAQGRLGLAQPRLEPGPASACAPGTRAAPASMRPPWPARPAPPPPRRPRPPPAPAGRAASGRPGRPPRAASATGEEGVQLLAPRPGAWRTCACTASRVVLAAPTSSARAAAWAASSRAWLRAEVGLGLGHGQLQLRRVDRRQRLPGGHRLARRDQQLFQAPAAAEGDARLQRRA